MLMDFWTVDWRTKSGTGGGTSRTQNRCRTLEYHRVMIRHIIPCGADIFELQEISITYTAERAGPGPAPGRWPAA